jgi:cytochrome c oxidase subunit III
MSPITEHIEKEKRPKLGGGGPGKTPYRHGFGGGDDGDRGRPDDFRSGRDRLRRFRVGIIAGIVSVAMLFAGLTVVFVMRQRGYHWNSQTLTGTPDWHPLSLPYRLLFVNTFVLVVSSVTLELARGGLLKKAEFTTLGILPPKLQTDLPWLGITVLLGFGFLGGQIMAWNFFRNQGVYIASYPSGSFFYLLTGLHAVHLLGGLIALIYTLIGSWTRMKIDSQRIAVDITGWYWHFMAVLWIYIFALLHFAKGSN